MDHLRYLLILAGCVVVTAPLEFVLGARVYRRARVAVFALAPVVAVYAAWDLLGIVREHWWYNPRYVSGIGIGPVPIEELLFFVVVPLCGLLTYEAVGTVLRVLAAWRRRRGHA